jgi:hypothetical protein
MAIREELILDISRALRDIEAVERTLGRIGQPIDIPIDGDTRPIEADLQRLEATIPPIDVPVDADTSGLEQGLERTRGLIDLSEDEARRFAQEIAAGATQSEALARATGRVEQGIDRAEDEAQGLTKELRESAKATEDLDRKSGGSFGRLEQGLKRVAIAAAAAFSVRAIGGFVGESVRLAGALEEAVSKAEVTFGKFSETVFDFTSKAPQDLNLTRQEAIAAASTFGVLFTGIGFTQEAAADLSGQFVQLGADLSSFNDISVEDAIGKLTSGLVGQSEPLRSVGVLLSEAAVQAKAYELGLGGLTGQLTEQEKVQARVALILEQTTLAQGDLARTADSYTNTNRRAAKSFEELQAQIGEALLPLFTEILAQSPQLIAALEELVPVLSDISAQLSGAVGPAASFIGFLGDAQSVARGLLGVLGQIAQTDFVGAVDTTKFIVEVQSAKQALDDGAKSTEVFAQALVNLGRRGTLTAERLEEFASITGVSPEQQTRIIQGLLRQARALDLQAESVDFLRGKLTELNREYFEITRQGALVNFLVTNPQDALTEAQALQIIAAAADELGVSIADLGTVDTGDLPDEISRLGEALATLSPEVLRTAEVADSFGRFADAIDTGIGRVGDAIDGFAELPKKLEISKEKFLENLTVSAQEQAAFEANLARLFNVAPFLALELQRQGVASRGLVTDFLGDTFSAQRADAILRGEAQAVTGNYVEQIITQLAGSKIDPAVIEEFLSQLADPQAAREAALRLEALLNQEINKIQLTYTGEIVLSPTLRRGAGGFFELAGGGGSTYNINTTINNPTTQSVTSDAQTSTQIIGGVTQQLTRTNIQ